MESQKRYTKKQRTLDIIERLKKEYPDTVCTLDTSSVVSPISTKSSSTQTVSAAAI